jgi:hypothetical protein
LSPVLFPHKPDPTPIEVRAGSSAVAGALAGVNDVLLASSQPEGAERVDVSGRIPHGPSGDGVRRGTRQPPVELRRVASGRLTPGTLAGLDRSLWRDLVLRLSPIGLIGLNPPRSSLTSGKKKICGDNASEPL